MSRTPIHLTVLGGGQSIGKSCFLLSVGDQHVLLDCGSFVGKDTRKALPDFAKLETAADFLREIVLLEVQKYNEKKPGESMLPYLTEAEISA